MSGHALLSASSAKRWLTCTPSARLAENYPDTQSEYAAEGTLAHAIAELKLRKYIEPMSNRTYSSRMKKLQEDVNYSAEMQNCTDAYMDRIKETAMQSTVSPHIAAERKVSFDEYVPEGYGTADCILIGGDTLHVFDYKHGKGVPVSAENNPQIKLYALGAYKMYECLYDIKTIAMHIIQPRLDNYSDETITTAELLAWGDSIKKPAQMAYNGEGEFVPGEHCRFCPCKATCRARSDVYTALDDFTDKKPAVLTPDEIGDILKKIDGLKTWAADVSDYALSQILAGNNIPGWKAVEGRSNRNISDMDTAFNLLKIAGYPDEVLYEKTPLTLTKLEKLVGKNNLYDLIGEYVEKPQGKPTLAPDTDKRPLFTTISATDDFKN